MIDENKAEARRETIRRFMASRRLKAASWARKAGVSSSAIYNFLNGTAESLAQKTLEKLAGAAGVDIGVMLGSESHPPAEWGPITTDWTQIMPRGRSDGRSLRLTIDQEVTPDQASRIWAILDETKP